MMTVSFGPLGQETMFPCQLLNSSNTQLQCFSPPASGIDLRFQVL